MIDDLKRSNEGQNPNCSTGKVARIQKLDYVWYLNIYIYCFYLQREENITQKSVSLMSSLWGRSLMWLCKPTLSKMRTIALPTRSIEIIPALDCVLTSRGESTLLGLRRPQIQESRVCDNFLKSSRTSRNNKKNHCF